MGPDKIYIESDISVFIDAPPRMSRWQLTSEELASERASAASQPAGGSTMQLAQKKPLSTARPPRRAASPSPAWASCPKHALSSVSQSVRPGDRVIGDSEERATAWSAERAGGRPRCCCCSDSPRQQHLTAALAHRQHLTSHARRAPAHIQALLSAQQLTSTQQTTGYIIYITWPRWLTSRASSA
jgi:hypothetical protein